VPFWSKTNWGHLGKIIFILKKKVGAFWKINRSFWYKGRGILVVLRFDLLPPSDSNKNIDIKFSAHGACLE